MAKSDRLRLADVRAAFRLLGECRELGNDALAWRRHMLEGLRQLTGAQVALYLHLEDVSSSDGKIGAALDSGFLDDSGKALWAHYQRENAHRDDPFHLRYFRAFSGALTTRSLEAVVDMAEWRRSRHYNEYVRACRLEDRITSAVNLAGAAPVTQVIVLHRSAADGPYSRRAERLVRLFHEDLVPLLGRPLTLPGTGDAELTSLPGRLQDVLRHLLAGESEKLVAAHLGLSLHTVNRHVQRLYRRLGVHSRSELMLRCRDLLPHVERRRE
ncbi:MAG TPA: helix-turn-helix transcriptional regulator [Gammaproteobacteria bacterium]